jgi:DNA-binding response OmpR family regulator
MSHRIMIVEDDPGLGGTLEAHLNSNGSRAMLVTSAESALAKIHDFDPDMALPTSLS